MKDNIREVVEIIENLSPQEGENKTKVSGLIIRKHSSELITHSVFRPLFCLTVQGDKEVEIGGTIYNYGSGDYVLVSADLALTATISNVSEEKPYLGVLIELDPLLVIDVLKDVTFEKRLNPSPERAVVVDHAEDRIVDAIKRLLLTLKNDENEYLSKLYIREIIFHLLSKENGHTLYQLGLMGGQFQKIKKSISLILNNYKDKINIEDMAKLAAMSTSSFHKSFKDVTGLSPIQYQKKIRLMQARALITGSGEDISSVAFEVGYESPSQFSREYLRQFGKTPSEERVKYLSAN
ncbi:AraC-type transcriptional regulator N-terminal domain protein [Bacteriovorax sp. BSW11_IV]|uniref:AraC family transcriptional regulator n=1 Tax=Bacteriovorax sp. BSW11_IV TaxID=1353529 RepID=UPI000389F63A|nr:AraC family transcriptional regulator [Bacteriovorax sp. BSW11_IV]EQC48297.1 AraC-type transcriptional regulator N-terminal domain protein [Bacteriovorax sp. BSW11_IV]